MDDSQQDKQGFELILITQEPLGHEETETGEIRIFTSNQATHQARTLAHHYMPPGRLLSEELIASVVRRSYDRRGQ